VLQKSALVYIYRLREDKVRLNKLLGKS